MKDRELARTKQCKHCPWKVDVDVNDIPNYIAKKHQNLKSTIASEDAGRQLVGDLHVMACHETTDTKPAYCVGWLHHQLGRGNNIGLRFQMRHYSNAGDIEVFGEQYTCFEDTLPENRY